MWKIAIHPNPCCTTENLFQCAPITSILYTASRGFTCFLTGHRRSESFMAVVDVYIGLCEIGDVTIHFCYKCISLDDVQYEYCRLVFYVLGQ